MKDVDLRIKDLQKKQELLKNKEKALKAKLIEDERKNRTRRLIKLGGAVESVLGKLEPNEVNLLVAFLTYQEETGKYVSKALGRKTNESKEYFEL